MSIKDGLDPAGDCISIASADKATFTRDCNDKVAKRVTDECALAKLEEIRQAIINNPGGGGGGIECQELVIDLTADTWVAVPHTFTSKVCDVKTYDTLGNEIDIVSRKSGIGLELCSTADIMNVLVIVEGE